MTKQEEVDRILTLYTGKTGIHLDGVKRELSKAGVVIKTDRAKSPDDFVATEPLIKESQPQAPK